MRLPRYKEYRDSGLTWLGDIPARWHVKRIKHTTYLKGRVGWKGLTSDEYLDSGHAYLVTGTDFSEKFINWRECHYVEQARYEDDPFIQLRDGDLLITKDGTIGKLALVSGLDRPACLNSGIFLIRPTSDYVTEYMYWVLQSKPFKVFCDLSSLGSTIQHLYQNVFEDFAFPVPSLDEQFSIATFLDRETAKIDALIAEQKKLITLMAEKRQAAISHAVTKGLNPKATMKDSGVAWLGEMPAHWSVTRLKYVTDAIVDCPHETPVYDETGPYRVIRTADVSEGKLHLDQMYSVAQQEFLLRIRRMSLEQNDIVYGREGERWGFAAQVPESNLFCLGQRMMQFRAATGINPRFLMWQLNAQCTYRQGQMDTVGATSPHVNVSTIKNYALTHPPIGEQEEISAFLDAETSRLDKLDAEAARTISLLKERRSALIAAAVTGQIDVRAAIPGAVVESPEAIAA